MIRRDYILRMIEEFVRALARLRSLKQAQRWDEASVSLDGEFERLMGAGAQAVARLSETELLARLLQGEPTQAVRDKTFILVTLLQEAGDLEEACGRPGESRACRIKALHLLLYTLGSGEIGECPEFVPKIDMLTASLRDAPLPPQTQAMLMQHYERTGEFAKAEDALFALLEADSQNLAPVEFGVAFYRRLLTQSDAALSAGNLPRTEVEQGLQELEARRT